MRRLDIEKRILCLAVAAALLASPSFAFAQEEEPAEEVVAIDITEAPVPEAANLYELLDLVEKGFQNEQEQNKQREIEFKRARENQEQLVKQAVATLAAEEARSQSLETQYNTNESELGTKEAQLAERLGQLGELFGVVRQVATDTGGQIWDSLTSSQLGPRKEVLDKLGRSKELPSTQDLERLWFELQREMTEQGQVVRYRANVLTADGQSVEQDVVRAGPFSAVSNGKYLLWEPREQKLRELTRQPPSKYLSTVESFEEAEGGFAALAVDPSRGSLLSSLIQTPDFIERISYGGAVGYVIIVLGLLAASLGVVRFVAIMIASRGVRAQRKSDSVSTANPLGRVLAVYEENRQADAEVLELKLDEAVLKETSKLDRLLWLVKTVSVVAPLLGLLGTVTGMIQTFQMITLFGAGDPKMMAGGISEALVTTMLGLMTAVPLVLMHATLSNSTKRIIDVLDEQSAGLIARRAEQLNV